jgi:hypothetical protein
LLQALPTPPSKRVRTRRFLEAELVGTKDLPVKVTLVVQPFVSFTLFSKGATLRPIDYAVKCLQRALTRVGDDRFTPAVISPQITDITDFLIDLTTKYADDGSLINKFVISLEYDAIENEMLRQILPEDIRQPVFDARTQHEELQIKKENEIAEYNFGNARDYLDRQNDLALSIKRMVEKLELVVTPKLVDSVLRELGYNEP